MNRMGMLNGKVNMKWKCNLETVLENMYLLFFAILIGHAFLLTTTFEIVWPIYFTVSIRAFLIAVIFIRIAHTQDYDLKESVFVACVSVFFLMVWGRNHEEIIINTLLLIIGSKGISFQKIIKVYLLVTVPLLLITMGAALSGVTENLIYYQENRAARISFGICYPTDFSAHVLYSILGYGYLRKEKIRLIEIAGIVLTGIGIYIFCGARVNSMCLLLTAGIFLYQKIKYKNTRKKGVPYRMNQVWSSFLALSGVICGTFMVVMTILYSSESGVLNFLNRMINFRLSYGRKGIDLFGFSLFGEAIPMIGNGGLGEDSVRYFFLDCSYISIALQYGILLLGVILFIHCVIAFRARKEQDWLFLWILSIVAVQCMIEHHMLDLSYNPFLWALLADLAVRGKSDWKEKGVKAL